MTVSIGMAMSLDGFVADMDGDVTALYPNLVQGSMKDNGSVESS